MRKERKPKRFERTLTEQGWEVREVAEQAASDEEIQAASLAAIREKSEDAGAERATGETENIDLKGADHDKHADNSGDGDTGAEPASGSSTSSGQHPGNGNADARSELNTSGKPGTRISSGGKRKRGL